MGNKMKDTRKDDEGNWNLPKDDKGEQRGHGESTETRGPK